MLSPAVRLYHKYPLIAFCRLNKKHLKTFHNINKRAGRLKSLPALFITMMHANQTITRTCLLGQVPANDQTKPLLN